MSVRGAPHRFALALVLAAAASLMGACTPPVASVRFEIDMREEIRSGRFDPRVHALGVRGNRAPLTWHRSVYAQSLGDGRFAAELAFDSLPHGGQPALYRLHVERRGQARDDGWESARKHPLYFDSARVTLARAFGDKPAFRPLRRTGRIDLLGEWRSAHVTPRHVQVWVPPGYDAQPDRRYPVLYLHDGQHVFDAQAAGGEWMIDEAAQALAGTGEIEPPLIVAVHSTHERTWDYTPTTWDGRPGTADVAQPGRSDGGGAQAYARFLIEELKPGIDERYRTRSGADSTAVGGASLGALVSMWLVLAHPQTFGAALAASPPLWWGDGFMRRRVLEGQAPTPSPPRLWLDVGWHEGRRDVQRLRQMRRALNERGWDERTLAYVEDPQGSHDEASWAARAPGMLRFLYGPASVPASGLTPAMGAAQATAPDR